MTYRRWRVCRFKEPKWVEHRYYKTDQGAFDRHVLNGVRGFASRMEIKIKPNGIYFHPGGNDCLLWIQHYVISFGEKREYWEKILKKAREHAKFVMENKKKIKELKK